jgi:hypothetical protein
MDPLKGNCWPTWQQELLLRAAFLPGQEAIQAWGKWKSVVDVDDLDRGSSQLLPQLYRNLQNQGISHPLMMKFKGYYRYTWSKNLLLFQHVSSLLRSLHEVGIETLILDGAALALHSYQEYGLRPVDDFAILVRTGQAVTAIKRLRALGCHPMWELPEALTETYVSAGYAHPFHSADGDRIHLHWHVLPECRQINADDDFWQGAVPTTIHDVSTRVLNPTDQLLRVCVQGVSLRAAPSFLWVADAMKLLTAVQAEIDWDRLITQARKRRLILPLRDALDYAQDVLDAPIPSAVFQRIQGIPTTKQEQIEHKLRTHRMALWRRLSGWFTYSRYTSHTDWVHQIVGFPRFLQHLWRLDHLWQVPFFAVSNMAARLRPY